ncbi:HPr family phosphocarrier protein [Priestia megaterium]|jgi:phosphocarrier protein|uniref:HPr family phosphocarrier protein n=1 Tax=Priestia megaterium TaxID=1404 RepID=UPI0019512B13|nr:HPr family phosphocarrier protein [Priestia megaterium]MBM6602222.1 HPr family phosphocarrier protein [Priestia megaterium]MCA4157578.1 HPr family phosphocarrier protein [Priestia megaterium]MCR8866577.1 HPr family phosphocarrier protein [Priestia megaterium]MDR0132511.1 HPr family phosphocarrier protein [Priestia megaterium]MDR7206831.1 phosphocarrier protein [Priestia megaterium]
MIEKQYKIIADTGFARIATFLVSVACKFTSTILLEYRGRSVNLKNSTKSLMDTMSLAIMPGSYITIRAERIDEQQALQSIEDYLNKKKLVQEDSTCKK